jgi:hypothetical protein
VLAHPVRLILSRGAHAEQSSGGAAMEPGLEATGNGWSRPSAVDPMVAAMPVGL